MKSLCTSLVFLLTSAWSLHAQTEKVERYHLEPHSLFEQNKGQVQGADGNHVQYFMKSHGLVVFLTDNGISYQFERVHQAEIRELDRIETHRMDVRLLGMDEQCTISTAFRSSDYLNYYNHNAIRVHTYKEIRYHHVYPNIDWVIRVNDGHVKYDFVVHPGGNPGDIRLQVAYADTVGINELGNMSIRCSMGEITEFKPISFQSETSIETRFVQDGNTISFELDTYDPNESLTVDPSVVWSTYYGANEIDYGQDVAVDSRGNVYLCGDTRSATAIASGGHQNTYGGTYYDAFVVKFDSKGQRKWGSYYGGKSEERCTGVAVDSKGAVYITGTTRSTTGIFANGYRSSLLGTTDAFLAKFSSLGTRQWGTYYGGRGLDDAKVVVVDGSDNVYIAGSAKTTRYAGYYAKFNSAGNRQFEYKLITQSFSTYGTALDIDKSGNIYFGGYTYSNTGIAKNGHQAKLGGRADAFLAKTDARGSLVWATYYGGSEQDDCNHVETDDNGDVYMVGSTASTSNIDSSGYQASLGGNYDAYLVKFNSNGKRQWGTYFGGKERDYAYELALDTAQNVYVYGSTASTNAIASGGLQNTLAGGTDAFIAKFKTTGGLDWGTYYGGTDSEDGYGIHVDDLDNIVISGRTKSARFVGANGHQKTFGGNYDAFLSKISQCKGDSGVARIRACESFKWIDGKTYTKSISDIYFTTTSDLGCDSVVELRLTILESPKRTYNISACGPIEFDRNHYDRSGTYEYAKSSPGECDSTITLVLNITSIDKTITESGTDLIANEQHASYQWLRCDAMSPVSGAVSRVYTVTKDGEYAVELSKNGCVDTSSCVLVKTGSLTGMTHDNIRIHPNPFTQEFTIDLGGMPCDQIRITNLQGQTVYTLNDVTRPVVRLSLDNPNGIYFVQLIGEGVQHTKMMVKQR